MKIFLDDVRDPPDNTWVVVRTYNEFVDLITSTPNIITEISFDHDLGMEPDDTTEAKNGMAAAKAFMELAMDNPKIGQMLERVNVHSANIEGAKDIESYFRTAKKLDKLNPNISITY